MNTLTFDTLTLDDTMLAELRSDHAGEYGAVAIYQGILAVARTDELRQFAERHLLTEKQHLAFMEDFFPPQHRTRLLPLWRAMGWLLGALPALMGGDRAAFITIAAVEQFVESHYQRQIIRLEQQAELRPLGRMLARFCAEEVAHKTDAVNRQRRPAGIMGRLWSRMVGSGSAAAVAVAKRI